MTNQDKRKAWESAEVMIDNLVQAVGVKEARDVILKHSVKYRDLFLSILDTKYNI